MFFLLPVLAGVIGSAAATAGEVALGIGAATAIGAGIKGAIDLKDASDYQDIASYKYNEAVEKTKKEVSKTQDALMDFAKLKLITYNGILKKSLAFLNQNKAINSERINQLSDAYKTSRNKFSSVAHNSVDLRSDCCFGDNRFELEDFVRTTLGGPIGFLMASSEKLTNGIQANAEADVQCELLEADRKICKAINKRIGEGKKIINTFTSRLDSLISYGPSAAVAVLPMAESLFQIIDVDLVDREGKLIESSANLYRIKMREVMNE